jgi:hypothetical protein
MNPRGTRHSLGPSVALTMSSPSPACGTSEYATQRPSALSVVPLIERQVSQSVGVSGRFTPDCA